MEENSNTVKVINVFFFLNDNPEEKTLTIEIENNLIFLTYKAITQKFFNSFKILMNFEKENNENCEENDFSDIYPENLIFDYIRYLDTNGWILLEENDFFSINDKDILQLMVKVTVLSQEKLRIKKWYERKDIEIDELIKTINNLSNPRKGKDKNGEISNYALDVMVLTANPLMDGENELGTMNDFNMITSSIQKTIEGSLKTINAEFWPLTFERFKNVLIGNEPKPIILHLICKSTYIFKELPKDKNSSDLVNLIFEKEDYNLEFINKKSLDDIYNQNAETKENFEKNIKEKIKENIKDITLIISTQLAEDVGKMFENFEFKYILVQHTTITDLEYIYGFNQRFYENIIVTPNTAIKYIYEEALFHEYEDVFCCCFHSHSNECEFMKNIQNELYNHGDNNNNNNNNNDNNNNTNNINNNNDNNNANNINNNNVNNNNNLFKAIPHFCHLRLTGLNVNYYNYRKNFVKWELDM